MPFPLDDVFPSGNAVPTDLVSTISDDFDDGVVNTVIWQQYRGPVGEEHGSALVPTWSGVGNRLATLNIFDLTGGSVFIRTVAFPPNSGAESQLLLGLNPVDDNNEYNSFLAIAKSGTSINFRKTTGFSNNDVTLTFDPVQHRWWRIRESGGTIFWDTAPDDGTGLAPGTWTNRRSLANPFSVTQLRIELKCNYNGASLMGETFEVSHFNTSGSQPAAAPIARPGRLRVAIGNAVDLSNLTAHASEYDYLVAQAAHYDWRDAVKAINPNVKVLGYKDAAGVANVSGTQRGGATSYMTGVSKAAADAGGSTWYLHSVAAGGVAADPSSRIQFADYPGIYAGNIGLRDYQQAWVNGVIADLAAGQFDGVFVDDTNPSMGNHSAGGAGDVAEYPSDAAYGAAFDSFMAYVVPALRAAGLTVVTNFGPFWGDRTKQTQLNKWVNLYQVNPHDEFFVKWRDLTFHTPDQIVAQIQNVRHALSRGRFVPLTIPGQAGQSSAPGARLAMACAWLVTRGPASTPTYWDKTNGAYTDWDTFAEQGLFMGAPTQPYRAQTNGLFFRPFTNGEVWVNITGSSQTATFVHFRPSDGATSAVIPTNDAVIFSYGTPVAQWLVG